MHAELGGGAAWEAGPLGSAKALTRYCPGTGEARGREGHERSDRTGRRPRCRRSFLLWLPPPLEDKPTLGQSCPAAETRAAAGPRQLGGPPESRTHGGSPVPTPRSPRTPPYSASLLCGWPPRGLLTGDSCLGTLLAAATPDDIFGWQLGVGDATGS